MPLIYQQRIIPDPLTPEQLKQTLNLAASLTPPGHDIWFIYVRTNRIIATDRCWAASVYFTPDVATDRIRRGKSICVGGSSLDPHLLEILNRLEDKPPAGVRHPELQEYIQISDAAHPFVAQLTTPEIPLLPFAAPEHLTNEEVVEIVDLARKPAPTENNSGLNYPIQLGWPSADEPILEIEKNADTITVRFGWCEGPLSAGGHELEIRKVDGHYQVVGCGLWVS